MFKFFKENTIFSSFNILPIITCQVIKGEFIICVSNVHFLLTLNMLKNHINFQYKLLSCISGVDLLNSKYRFVVVYDLLSLIFNSRLRLKVFVNEVTSIESATSLFVNADWWEREVWDMYGINFLNHANLRRILTDYGFEGFPLRKDFPLSGYVEVRYDQSKKRVIVESLELSQEFRAFSYVNVW